MIKILEQLNDLFLNLTVTKEVNKVLVHLSSRNKLSFSMAQTDKVTRWCTAEFQAKLSPTVRLNCQYSGMIAMPSLVCSFLPASSNHSIALTQILRQLFDSFNQSLSMWSNNLFQNDNCNVQESFSEVLLQPT